MFNENIHQYSVYLKIERDRLWVTLYRSSCSEQRISFNRIHFNRPSCISTNEWQAKEENRGYFPPVSVRGERKLTIILTTRYCFIFLSRIGLAKIRMKVENNSEETKRRNATPAVFNVYGIQVKRIKKKRKKFANWKKERKMEWKMQEKIATRPAFRIFLIAYRM